MRPPTPLEKLFVVPGCRTIPIERDSAITVGQRRYGVIVQVSAIHCSGGGETLEEAIERFWKMFDAQWAALVECDLDKLTAGPRNARARLIAFKAAADSIEDQQGAA